MEMPDDFPDKKMIRAVDHFAEEIQDPVLFSRNRKRAEILIEEAQRGEGPLVLDI